MLFITRRKAIVFFVQLTMLILVACSAEPLAALSATVTENAVVYGGPRVSYDVIGHLSSGTNITLNGRNGDTWVSFTYNGQTGWIQNFFLKIDGYYSDYQRLPENTNITFAIKTPTVSSNLSISSSDVNWMDAGRYLGKYIKVCGPVIGTDYASSSNGSPTFLNVGEDYPSTRRFVILIWGENRRNFSFSPESSYLGKTICARGEIETYNGIYQVEVSSPSSIEIR